MPTTEVSGDGVTSVTAALEALNDETDSFVPRKGWFAVSVSGTFTATVALQRSFPTLAPGVFWYTVDTFTAPEEVDVRQVVEGTLWRLVATAFTDGSVNATMLQGGRQPGLQTP